MLLQKRYARLVIFNLKLKIEGYNNTELSSITHIIKKSMYKGLDLHMDFYFLYFIMEDCIVCTNSNYFRENLSLQVN